MSTVVRGGANFEHLEALAAETFELGWHLVLHLKKSEELVALAPRLRALPKVELHVHLEGTAPPALVRRLGGLVEAGLGSLPGVGQAMALRDLERVLYFEAYVVVDPGETELKQNQLLNEEQYRKAREEHQHRFRAQMGAEAIKELLAIKVTPNQPCIKVVRQIEAKELEVKAKIVQLRAIVARTIDVGADAEPTFAHEVVGGRQIETEQLRRAHHATDIGREVIVDAAQHPFQLARAVPDLPGHGHEHAEHFELGELGPSGRAGLGE